MCCVLQRSHDSLRKCRTPRSLLRPPSLCRARVDDLERLGYLSVDRQGLIEDCSRGAQVFGRVDGVEAPWSVGRGHVVVADTVGEFHRVVCKGVPKRNASPGCVSSKILYML